MPVSAGLSNHDTGRQRWAICPDRVDLFAVLGRDNHRLRACPIDPIGQVFGRQEIGPGHGNNASFHAPKNHLMPFGHPPRDDRRVIAFSKAKTLQRLREPGRSVGEVAERNIASIAAVRVKADQSRLVRVQGTIVDNIKSEIEIAWNRLIELRAGGFVGPVNSAEIVFERHAHQFPAIRRRPMTLCRHLTYLTTPGGLSTLIAFHSERIWRWM